MGLVVGTGAGGRVSAGAGFGVVGLGISFRRILHTMTPQIFADQLTDNLRGGEILRSAQAFKGLFLTRVDEQRETGCFLFHCLRLYNKHEEEVPGELMACLRISLAFNEYHTP